MVHIKISASSTKMLYIVYLLLALQVPGYSTYPYEYSSSDDDAYSRPDYYSTTSMPRIDLRLIDYMVKGGGHSKSGRLEIYFYQDEIGYRWTPICSTYFDQSVANLACQRLGYAAATKYGRVGLLGYDQGIGSSIKLDCPTYATSLSNCSWSTVSCSHYYDVGLMCTYIVYTTIPPYVPYEGKLRLVSHGNSNTTQSAGRLEIYTYVYSRTNYSGFYEWTTFCSYNFSNHYADVACQQLGFTRALGYGTVSNLGYDQGSGSQSITHLDCASYVYSFQSCSYGASFSCSHSNDVAIRCTQEAASDKIKSGDKIKAGDKIKIGLSVGLTVGPSILFSAFCVGVICIVYRKRRIRSLGTFTIEPPKQHSVETGTYHVSHEAAKEDQPEVEVYDSADDVDVDDEKPLLKV